MILAIPKRRVPVTLCIQHGPELPGFLFVDTAAAVHSGSQTLSEYLAEPDSFVPFETSGEIMFVSKPSIAVVTVKEEDEMGQVPWDALPLLPEDDAEALREVRVRLEMRGGRAIEGEIVSAMPPEHRRVIDYLNQSTGFLSLRQGEDIHIVNKLFIASARPVRRS